MRVNVINLDRSMDRLAEFTTVNGHLADVARFPAIDGQRLDIASLVRRGIVTQDILDLYPIGAVGNAMSHIALWDMAIESGQNLTISEDDAIFNARFDSCSAEMIKRLPAEWDLILWGWHFDFFLCFEMLPGVSHCLAQFELDRMRSNSQCFQEQSVSPHPFKLLWAFGLPSYTISPKGARGLKGKLLPLRPVRLPLPQGVSTPDHERSIATKGLDSTLNSVYRHVCAFLCFPPLVINKIDLSRSTVQLPEEEVAKCDKLLATNPKDTTTLNRRGFALQRLKRFEDALESYDRALAIQPNHVVVLRNRGNALLEQQRFEEALASYDRALAIGPEDATTLSGRGFALQRLKRFEDALESYERALAIQPNHVVVLRNRGNALLEQQRFEEALASYDKALAIGPENVATLNRRGLVLQRLKRIDEAIASYDRALAIQPNHAVVLRNRGNAMSEKERSDEARLASIATRQS